MIRHAKKLQSKSRAHQVILDDASVNRFKVISGTSGKEYLVNIFEDGKAGCSCDWAKHRPDSNKGACGCSHVVAVHNFILEDRTVYVWTSEENANRQKNVSLDLGDGLILTAKVRS